MLLLMKLQSCCLTLIWFGQVTWRTLKIRWVLCWFSCRGFENSVIQLLAYNLAEKLIFGQNTGLGKIETRA